MAKRIRRRTNKVETKETVKEKVQDNKIQDLAKALRDECISRKCNCPFFDDNTGECKLAQEHLATPMNWEID